MGKIVFEVVMSK